MFLARQLDRATAKVCKLPKIGQWPDRTVVKVDENTKKKHRVFYKSLKVWEQAASVRCTC